MKKSSSWIFVEEGNVLAREMLRQEGLPFCEDVLESAVNVGPLILVVSNAIPDVPKLKLVKRLIDSGSIILADMETSDRLNFRGVRTLPFNFKDYSCPGNSQVKGFDSNGRVPRERVAVRGMRGLRVMLTDHIKSISWKRDMPYVHKWYYPNGNKTVCSFKIDLDEFNEKDIHKLVSAGISWKDAVTWFVCCNSIAGQDETIKKIIDPGYDVQSHGYFHHVYNGNEENIKNISRSIDFLKKHGVSAKGFSGPMGKWNICLDKVLNSLGIEYSSEFGYDYDNLPSFPFLGTKTERVSDCLQIPIIPLCLGSFIESGIADQAEEYFLEMILNKYSNREPIMLYGHPVGRLGRNIELFETVMKKLASLDSVAWMNFSGINKWWRKRDLFSFDVECGNDGEIKLKVDNIETDDIYLRLEKPGKKEAFVKCDKENIGLSDIEYNDFSPYTMFYEEKDEPDSFKKNILDMIDWEEVTPVDEIPKNNFAKIILRKWKQK